MIRAKPYVRALAVLLCFQPAFFHSSVVLAQNLERVETLAVPGQQQDLAQPFAQPAPDPNPTGAARGAGASSGSSDSLTRAMPAVDEPVNPDTYVCGPGDLLELNFWGLQNIRLRVAIDVEGRAFVPKVGYFQLAGKTLAEVRRALRNAASQYYPRLSFDLTLAEPRTFLVQVAGAVLRPASYPSRATDRVAALVARAGGFGPNASRRRIDIRHRDGREEQADLLRFTLTGDNRFNPHVLDGDAIQVGFEELAASIDGGVNRPGRYELIETKDLAELVELAGGLSPASTTELPITIVRWSAVVRQEQLLVPFGEAGGVPPTKVQREDAVRLPTTADVQTSVYVIGAVAGAVRAAGTTTTEQGRPVETIAPDEASATRRVPFVGGETVRGLLERVGGVGPLADMSRSYLLRDQGILPVDLEKLIVLRDLSADREIQLGDTLVVPFKRRNILVEGAVFAPGSYPYNPTYGVQEYLALAGGPSRNAQSVSNIRVVTPAGEMKAYQKDLVVQPGSSVVVPERNFSRAEVVQIGLGIASVIVSGIAVMLAAKKL